MSHFSVAVFSKMPGYVEALLAPFEEQVDPDSPYAEFVENEECDLDKTVGAGGYWHNPNARWDWWEIGGRWRGLLRLLPGKSGYRAPVDRWSKGFDYPAVAATGRGLPTAISLRIRAVSPDSSGNGRFWSRALHSAKAKTSSAYGSRSIICNATGTRKPTSAERQPSVHTPLSRQMARGMSRGAWAGLASTMPPTRA